MKKSLFIIPALMCALALTSCSSSQSALSDLRSLSNEINANGSTYSISDWKSVGQKYVSTTKKIANYTAQGKYSQEELSEIGTLEGQCVKGFKDGASQGLTDKVTGVIDLFKGLINGLTK